METYNTTDTDEMYVKDLLPYELRKMLAEGISYKRINVSKLAERVGIARESFYHDYRNLNSVLDKIYVEDRDSISDKIENCKSLDGFLAVLLEYVKANDSLCRAFFEIMPQKCYMDIYNMLNQYIDPTKGMEAMEIACHAANGIVLGEIVLWVSKGCSDQIDTIATRISSDIHKIMK